MSAKTYNLHQQTRCVCVLVSSCHSNCSPSSHPPHRFHLIGLLVLFVQDIGDIALEFSKTIIYFKDRNGRTYYWPEFFANVGFGFFTIQQ